MKERLFLFCAPNEQIQIKFAHKTKKMSLKTEIQILRNCTRIIEKNLIKKGNVVANRLKKGKIFDH